MAVCNPAEQMAYHFKNGQGDECLFIHYGSGVCYTMFGTLKFGRKDYLVIPKGTIYTIIWDERARTAPTTTEFGGYPKAEMPYGKFVSSRPATAQPHRPAPPLRLQGPPPVPRARALLRARPPPARDP
jgi:hypothetical protein